ncbi:MAG: terminase large subunit domain-containing protein, partial [Gemmatimonadales bacterium]
MFEIVYGGARGGGKTDAALGDFALHARCFGAGAQGLLVRRTRVALEPTIARARQIYGPEGARWVESRSCFAWPSGAVLYFRFLDNDADADRYQGHAYTRVYVEELTQFGDPRAVDKLKATLRSAAGVPCGFRATCNPGGAGHNWVKARYIDAGAGRIVTETFINPFDGSTLDLARLFIPARLADNPALLANDPGYVARLQLSGSKELVRAWLEGDWNIVEGAFFDNWSGRNLVRPFAVPEHWTRFRALDWGSARPFSVGWWTICPDPFAAEGEGGAP